MKLFSLLLNVDIVFIEKTETSFARKIIVKEFITTY